MNIRGSSKEFPTYLYFSRRPVDFFGMRIRIEYSAYASELTTEAGTTVIPLEYIKPAALSMLHSQKIQYTRSDRDLHFGEWKRYGDMAEQYLVRNAPHMPDSIVWQNPERFYEASSENPLHW